MRLFTGIVLLTLLGAAWARPVLGQSATAPKYSNEFLSIGVGARALGMANTQAAVANDVTAAYWNPAGLLKIDQTYQAALMHAEYFGGVASYDYGAFSTKLDDSGRLAFSLIRMGVDNIPDTRLLIDNAGLIDYNRVGSFSEASYAFMASYARESNLIKGLRGGASVKVIHRTAGVFANSWGFGLDVGAQLDRGKWHFGAVGRDITSTFNIWNYNPETFIDVFAKTGNQIPNNSIEITLPRAILEVGRSLDFGPNLGLLLTTGFTFTFDGKRNTLIQTSLLSGQWQAGGELHYKKLFFVRGGVGGFQRLENFDQSVYTQMQPSFGLGFHIKNVAIDYALTNLVRSEAVLYSHVFSLKANFEPKPKKQAQP